MPRLIMFTIASPFKRSKLERTVLLYLLPVKTGLWTLCLGNLVDRLPITTVQVGPRPSAEEYCTPPTDVPAASLSHIFPCLSERHERVQLVLD
jgi:hypothetical protein